LKEAMPQWASAMWKLRAGVVPCGKDTEEVACLISMPSPVLGGNKAQLRTEVDDKASNRPRTESMGKTDPGPSTPWSTDEL